jgi:hypothetical protein
MFLCDVGIVHHLMVLQPRDRDFTLHRREVLKSRMPLNEVAAGISEKVI